MENMHNQTTNKNLTTKVTSAYDDDNIPEIDTNLVDNEENANRQKEVKKVMKDCK